MLAAALSLAGLHAYWIIREIHSIGGTTLAPEKNSIDSGEILANGMRNVLFDCGALVGLAGIVYLLAHTGPEESVTSESIVSLAGAD